MIRKPQRRTYRVEYWFCGDVNCKKHSTEEAAARCIEKQRNPKPRRTNVWNDAKYQQAADLRASGKTLREVGEAFGVTPERVRQVLNRWERKLRWRAMRGIPDPPRP